MHRERREGEWGNREREREREKGERARREGERTSILFFSFTIFRYNKQYSEENIKQLSDAEKEKDQDTAPLPLPATLSTNPNPYPEKPEGDSARDINKIADTSSFVSMNDSKNEEENLESSEGKGMKEKNKKKKKKNPNQSLECDSARYQQNCRYVIIRQHELQQEWWGKPGEQRN